MDNEKKKYPSFTNKSFIAECCEDAIGNRYISIYHKNLTAYDPKRAKLHDPITIFKFAAWVVKASEWVNAQRPMKPINPIAEYKKERKRKKRSKEGTNP